MGDPSWAKDPRFADVVNRYRHQEEINQHLKQWTSTQDKHQVMRRLQDAGVPAGAVQNAKDLVEDPHLLARGFMVPVERPVVGKRLFPGVSTRLSRTPGSIRRPPPGLGEHNALVLGGLLGVSPEELEHLAETKVIGNRPLDTGASTT